MEFSDTAGRVVPRWFHVDSFFECADVEGRLTDIDQIDGADRLRCAALIGFFTGGEAVRHWNLKRPGFATLNVDTGNMTRTF